MKTIDAKSVYEPSDLNDQFWEMVKEAKQLWAQRIQEYIDKNGQNPYFSVVGAGIEILFLPPRHKKPKYRIIIDPDSLVPSPNMGGGNSCLWQGSADEVVAFLRSKGIECSYSCGYDN